ncbi:NUDIX domain-containing protein [Demequina sediminicola]|uniref:NUDIX domain-containing protein n=1 Tax=Demequina sediminicola TaxID=1095026 RepID=UPI000784BB39|nr:NUDIX domain-containing protein [Demequina sediminicola]
MPAPHSPHSTRAPRLSGHRDPGDAWVYADDGTKYWGRFGAAGLVAVDPGKGMLLQHRAQWSHHGGTWGIPGGALHANEAPIDGAIREAGEEAGVPAEVLRPRLTWVADYGVWQYTTVVADVTEPFTAEKTDAESIDLEWVPIAQLRDIAQGRGDRVLHPAFATALPSLLEVIDTRPHLIIDAANVVGSVPDGWWKDRAAATERVIQSLTQWTRNGVNSADLGLQGTQWFPRVTVVTEGSARGQVGTDQVNVEEAAGHGDDAIVAAAQRVASTSDQAWVVTSDRELQNRVTECGAQTRTAGWLRHLMS